MLSASCDRHGFLLAHPEGSPSIDIPDTPGDANDPVDLPAVRADDALIEAIIRGFAVSSSDPTESRLIELLVAWHRWSTGRPPELAP